MMNVWKAVAKGVASKKVAYEPQFLISFAKLITGLIMKLTDDISAWTVKLHQH